MRLRWYVHCSLAISILLKKHYLYYQEVVTPVDLLEIPMQCLFYRRFIWTCRGSGVHLICPKRIVYYSKPSHFANGSYILRRERELGPDDVPEEGEADPDEWKEECWLNTTSD